MVQFLIVNFWLCYGKAKHILKALMTYYREANTAFPISQNSSSFTEHMILNYFGTSPRALGYTTFLLAGPAAPVIALLDMAERGIPVFKAIDGGIGRPERTR